ncbi:MAG: HAD family hydrolase, partial [Candidatus Izemoplasmatales bacterium]|nr:HAD family hydrolase [Candidatus Izemoplasmatales bacterium]
VIFDLDGTLLDTIEDIKETLNQVLRKYNYSEFSTEEYKYFVGKGVDNLIKQVINVGNIDSEAFYKLKSGYYDVYVKQSTVNTKIYEGITELLTELKQIGISLNVLSNKPHSQTIEVIKHYFGDDIFDLVYGKKEEFLPKPHPDSASDLIANLKLNPEEILYVGDTETDMFTANNAGFYSVGVLWGFRKEEELINAGANKIVENPLEILELF